MLLESKFGLMGAFVTYLLANSQAGGQPPEVADAQPHEGSLGAPTSSPRLGPSAHACCFRGHPGCRAMFFAAAPRFSTSGNQQSAAAVHFRSDGSLSIFAIETLLALRGAELPNWWNSAKREPEIIAKPLRLLHESLLSGRSFLAPCAQKLATTLCPCNMSPAVRQFVLVAARRFLQSVTYFVGRSARAPSRRVAFAAFDLLICAGVEAGPW